MHAKSIRCLAAAMATIAMAAGICLTTVSTAAPSVAATTPTATTGTSIEYYNDYFDGSHGTAALPCLAPESRTQGARVEQTACPILAKDQRWKQEWGGTNDRGDKLFRLFLPAIDDNHPAMCLDTDYGHTVAGTPIVIGTCLGGDSHQWWLFDSKNHMENSANLSGCFTGLATPDSNGNYGDFLFPCSDVAVNQQLHALTTVRLHTSVQRMSTPANGGSNLVLSVYVRYPWTQLAQVSASLRTVSDTANLEVVLPAREYVLCAEPYVGSGGPDSWIRSYAGQHVVDVDGTDVRAFQQTFVQDTVQATLVGVNVQNGQKGRHLSAEFDWVMS